MRLQRAWLWLAAPAATIAISATWLAASPALEVMHPTAATSAPSANGLPVGVKLRQIDGGPTYYSKISSQSAWMDQHILVGAWLEEPMTATQVRYDVAMGNNIYWNLAGDPLSKACGGQPCRVNFNVIRAAGMHASAPDVTSKSGSETVAYEGSDEADMNFGPGANGWNSNGAYSVNSCIPSGSRCGYTVTNFYYSGKPASDGSPGYPSGQKAITQGYGKGVLFWESKSQAARFLKYSDTLSADSYWMTDPSLAVPSQGGCALFSVNSRECNNGSGAGLSTAQRRLPANYAYDVSRLRALEATIGVSKPIIVDIETGCPMSTGECVRPPEAVASAWHALIAGARGILWFQHNFSGACPDQHTFYDGWDPRSRLYNCTIAPGVTLHYLVKYISFFNHEVASLNSVLLSPFAMNYVDVGSADVSVMAKDAKGKFYVFAAAGKPGLPPAKNQMVKFHVAGAYTGPVAVVDEGRVLHAVNGVFTDVFANSVSVHIYRIGS